MYEEERKFCKQLLTKSYNDRVNLAAKSLVGVLIEINKMNVNNETKDKIVELCMNPLIAIACTCDGTLNIKERDFISSVASAMNNIVGYCVMTYTDGYNKKYNYEQISFLKNTYKEMLSYEINLNLAIAFYAFATADGNITNVELETAKKLLVVNLRAN